MRRQVRGHIHAVQFVIISFGEVGVEAFLHHHVTGGAGAVAAAGVLQVDAEVQRDVEQRFRLTMALIGQIAGLEFDRLADRKERNLGHLFIIAVRGTCNQMPPFSINIV